MLAGDRLNTAEIFKFPRLFDLNTSAVPASTHPLALVHAPSWKNSMSFYVVVE